MKNKEFIAYKGEEFTIEWYFSSSGKSNVLEYYNTLIESQKEKLFHLFQRMGDTGTITNKEKLIMKATMFLLSNPFLIDFYVFSLKVQELLLLTLFKRKHRSCRREKKNVL